MSGEPRRCPRCQGELEQRLTPKYEVVLECLGTCGTLWSLFDYELARP